MRKEIEERDKIEGREEKGGERERRMKWEGEKKREEIRGWRLNKFSYNCREICSLPKNRQLHGCRVKQCMKTMSTAAASFPGSIPVFHYVTGDLGRSLRQDCHSRWWMLIEKHMPFLSSNFPVLSPGTSVCEIVVLFALFLIG